MTQPPGAAVMMDEGQASGAGAAAAAAGAPPGSTTRDAAVSYALLTHEEFWGGVSKKRRADLVGVLVARARQQGMGNPELAKDLVRTFGVEVKDFGVAAAILAGYEAFSWTTFHWAGPSSYFAPNPAPRPDWVTQLAEEVAAEDEGETTDQGKGKGKASSSDLTPTALKRVRRRRGAPGWTKKLTRLIERHLEVDEQTGELVEVPEVL